MTTAIIILLGIVSGYVVSYLVTHLPRKINKLLSKGAGRRHNPLRDMLTTLFVIVCACTTVCQTCLFLEHALLPGQKEPSLYYIDGYIVGVMLELFLRKGGGKWISDGGKNLYAKLVESWSNRTRIVIPQQEPSLN